MIFRQLYEPISSTYTYLLGCEDTGMAVLIDPVINMIDRDLSELRKFGLKLAVSMDTHIHADHISSALELRKRVGCQIAAPAMERLACADIGLEEGNPFRIGSLTFHALHTPGHTDSHFSYLIKDRIFTGDALLIDGCGRTDFQNGDTDALYRTVTDKLFNLPGDYLVYPAHDYQNRCVSTITQEKNRNPRLGQGKSLDEFRQIMSHLNLPYPKFIEYAVPGNQKCGVCPSDLPENLQKYCEIMAQSQQG